MTRQQEYSRNYYIKNRERVIAKSTARNRRLRAERAVYNRKRHLHKQYGITIKTWAQMLVKQKGVCAVCKQPERKVNNRNGRLQPLCVDHDHKTGRVRGLLCCRCNRSIGLLGDDTQLIKQIWQYLNSISPFPEIG